MKYKILLITKTKKSFWETKYSLKITDKRVFADKDFASVYRMPLIGQALALAFVVRKGLLKSGQYDLVIIGDPRMAVVYSVFKNILKGNTKVLVDQLILPDKEEKLERFKNIIRKWAFSSVDGFIVNSQIERKIYSQKLNLPISRFFFIPIFVEDRWVDGKEIREEDFVFSGGGAQRDFKTFFTAIKDLPYKFNLMAFEYALRGLIMPKNCNLKKASNAVNFLKEIKKSKFVVVPLHATSKAAGQTTVVQAMSCRKAVIITNNRSLFDYVENGKTCLMVDPYNPSQLKIAINTLYKNKEKRKRLADNGYKKITHEFVSRKYFSNFENVINKVI